MSPSAGSLTSFLICPIASMSDRGMGQFPFLTQPFMAVCRWGSKSNSDWAKGVATPLGLFLENCRNGM